MGKHTIEVNRNEETIRNYALRIEQINRILNGYNDLIEEKQRYEYYLRTQVKRGLISKEEYDVIKSKGLEKKVQKLYKRMK